MGAAKQNELLRAGQHAPDFDLARLSDGTSPESVELAKLLASGPILLAFFKSTCPVCQMTLPFLQRIHQGRAPGSYQVYGVSQDDASTTREFVQEFGIGFPMLLDTEESGYPASNAYGLSHVPSLFLVATGRRHRMERGRLPQERVLALAAQAGVDPFRPDENVPEWKAG